MVYDIFDEMRQRMDNAFADFLSLDEQETPLLESKALSAYNRPATDVVEYEDTIEVTLDIPGVNKKDIDVHVEDNALVIRAKKETSTETKQEGVYRQERRYAGYQRTIALPAQVQANKAEANYENGVLRVHIPKDKTKSNKHNISVK